MTFIVLFEDNADKADRRQAHMAAHLAFLSANSESIEAAGPLFEGAEGSSGLWLVRAGVLRRRCRRWKRPIRTGPPVAQIGADPAPAAGLCGRKGGDRRLTCPAQGRQVRKLAIRRRPVASGSFSGWNWVPIMVSRPITAVTGPP